MLSADSSGFNAGITDHTALSLLADLSQTTHDTEASRGKPSMLPCATAVFTSVDEPIGFAVWSQLPSPRRPSIRFLFISSQVSHSLPSHPASRLRTWPLVIVLSFYDLVLTIADFNHIYIERMLGTLQASCSIPFVPHFMSTLHVR
ncbi:Unannotated [Lentimonas sp. CC19]|nr:Unannotated [Lentimonas sp. CC19]